MAVPIAKRLAKAAFKESTVGAAVSSADNSDDIETRRRIAVQVRGGIMVDSGRASGANGFSISEPIEEIPSLFCNPVHIRSGIPCIICMPAYKGAEKHRIFLRTSLELSGDMRGVGCE